MRKIAWTPNAWSDYLYWESDNKTRKKLNNIIKEIMRNPIDGKGKPEPLKGNYSGSVSYTHLTLPTKRIV